MKCKNSTLARYEVEVSESEFVATRREGNVTIVNVFPRGQPDQEERLTAVRNEAAEIVLRKLQGGGE